jgi:hypothetical protein
LMDSGAISLMMMAICSSNFRKLNLDCTLPTRESTHS